MFNGIIYNNGTISKIKKRNKSLEIVLKSNIKLKSSDVGESLCCNGVCLTITKIKKGNLSFYLSDETLKKSNFKFLKIGSLVNLEKSITINTKISGHYVQGHIDTTAIIKKIIHRDRTWIIRFFVESEYNKYLVEKASISINGVSLTISKSFKNQFEVNIIPHTLKLTNLSSLKINDLVNIEFDIFAKYLYEINN